MDAAEKMTRTRERYGLLITALAPVVPQILGSAFNIWYNATVIQPLLVSPALKQRFFETVVVYNFVVYPIGIFLWLSRIFSFRDLFHRLCAGSSVDSSSLVTARRQLIHLPWFAAAICGTAWFLCIPVFIGALLHVQNPLDPRLLMHLPISFCISGFIAVTHSFFLVELASYWGLFPFFFRDERADLIPGVFTLSLRGRGILWAISASICPIASLLLLMFAPRSPTINTEWFAVFVGVVGIAFGIFTALMMSWLVAKPIDRLRAAADAVSRGRFDVDLGIAPFQIRRENIQLQLLELFLPGQFHDAFQKWQPVNTRAVHVQIGFAARALEMVILSAPQNLARGCTGHVLAPSARHPIVDRQTFQLKGEVYFPIIARSRFAFGVNMTFGAARLRVQIEFVKLEHRLGDEQMGLPQT